MSHSTPLSYTTLPPPQGRLGWLKRGMSWFGWTILWIWMAGFVIGGLSGAIASVGGRLLGMFAPIGIILLLIAGSILARGVRRVRDLSVLNYLEQAVRLNIPLPAMLAAAERGERGGVQSRLRWLRRRFERGDTMAAALSIATPALSRRVIRLVTAGERTGRLSEAMRRVVARPDLHPRQNPTDAIFQRWYMLVVSAVLIAAVQVVLIFCAPRLESIMRGFDLPPPKALVAMRSFSDDFGVILLAAALLLVAIFCGRTMSLLFTSRGLTWGPLRRPVEAFIWFTPVAGGLVRTQATADVCHIIAGALDAGLPPAVAINESAAVCGNVMMERRVKRWAVAVSNGSDIAVAARTARLPKLVSGMLAATKDAGDIPATLRFLANYYDGRFNRASAFIRAAMIPAMAIGFGLIVAAVALGIFQPLVDIAYKASGR